MNTLTQKVRIRCWSE